MRFAVTGASGNVGTAVLRRLATEPQVDAVTAVARRILPAHAEWSGAGVEWHSIDIAGPGAVEELAARFAGAAAVIHLAWQIQPSHDRARLRHTNVRGSRNTAEAAVLAGVPALVAASSVGAYAPGPKDRRVSEDWPATGIPGSTYSEDKAAMEALLDRYAADHPELRVVRLRPGLTFQRGAASQIARYFLGPLAPLGLLRSGRLPVAPAHPRLRAQAVHTDDVADAYVRAALSDIGGAVNIAADPILDSDSLTGRFGGRKMPVHPALLQAGANLTWHARLQPTEPGWVRLGLQSPLMSTRRATAELGWHPRVTALDARAELLDGMAHRNGAASAPLRSRPSAGARLAAMLSGRLPGPRQPVLTAGHPSCLRAGAAPPRPAAR